MRRILICGARSWTNPTPIRVVLERELKQHRKEDLLVITGGAPGVDTHAAHVANKLGIHTAVVRALWDAYGRGAGPRRNAVMLTLDPEVVYAFHFSRERLREDRSGTARCMSQAQAKGIPVRLGIVPQEVADYGVEGWAERVAARKAKKRRRKSKS